jgi:hypothetical protein
MRRISAIVFTIASASACSLVVGTSGLSDGAAASDSGPAIDGGGDVIAVADSATNARDGETLVDSDAAASPCSVTHAFCDDFNAGGSDVTTRWTSAKQNAGPLTLDTTLFASPPRGLKMALQPGTGKRVTEIRKQVDTTGSVVRVDLDLHSSGPSSSMWTEFDPVEIALEPAPPGYDYHALTIAMYSNGTATFEYFHSKGTTSSVVVAPQFVLPMGRWVHVSVVADYSTSPGTGTISIDGAAAAQVAVGGSSLTGIEVAVGATYTEQANIDWTFGFDNVVVN